MKVKTTHFLLFTPEDKKTLHDMSNIAEALHDAFCVNTIADDGDMISRNTGEVLLTENEVITLNQILGKMLDICDYNPYDEEWFETKKCKGVKFVG